MSGKKIVALTILILFFGGFLIAAYKYIKFTREYASTDAMFIRTDRITNVSFKKVRGKVIKLFFKEGDFVKKGQIMAELDPTDYKIQLKAIEKKIDSLKNQKEKVSIETDRVKNQLYIKEKSAKEQIKMLKEQLLSLNYSIKELESNIQQVKRDYKRFKYLYLKKAIPKRKYEEIETKYNALKNKKFSLIYQKKSLIKKIDISKLNLRIIKQEFKKVEELEKIKDSISDNIKALEAQKQEVLNSINYCKLKAPFSGRIGKKYVEIGMNIRSGTPVYSLVDTKDLYVEVLLEETKLKGVKVGCKAYFKVDAYPDKKFEGVVTKIYPASAATYALVPRDISAGEFTKVAQRITIRVDITKGDKSLLISGMGGEINIKRAKTNGI